MSYRALYHILLPVLIFCFWATSIVGARTTGEDPDPIIGPQPGSTAVNPPLTARLFHQETVISEGGSSANTAEKGSALLEETPPRRPRLATKNLGLRLVGTVVADDPGMSLAVIENGMARGQRAYHEGDRAGQVLIKSILRNQVIIDAGIGDELLTMLHEQPSGSFGSQITGSQPAPQEAVGSRLAAARRQTFRLDRGAVASALRDVNQVMREVRLSPFKVYDRPNGLRITNIAPGSLPSEMGLRNGDVIKSVDGEAITGPEQAAEFLERLMEGGDVTIWVKGSRRSRRIDLKIE